MPFLNVALCAMAGRGRLPCLQAPFQGYSAGFRAIVAAEVGPKREREGKREGIGGKDLAVACPLVHGPRQIVGGGQEIPSHIFLSLPPCSQGLPGLFAGGVPVCVMGLLHNWAVLTDHLVEAEAGAEEWGLPGALASRISSG